MRRVTVNEILHAYNITGFKFEEAKEGANVKNDFSVWISEGSGHPLAVLAVSEGADVHVFEKTGIYVFDEVLKPMGFEH